MGKTELAIEGEWRDVTGFFSHHKVEVNAGKKEELLEHVDYEVLTVPRVSRGLW